MPPHSIPDTSMASGKHAWNGRGERRLSSSGCHLRRLSPSARLSVRANRPDVFQELQPRRLSVPLHAAGSSRSERTVLKPERIVGPSEPSYACGRSVRANRPARGWLQRAGLRGPHPSVRANRPDARSVRANRPEDRFQPNSPPPSHSIEVGMVAFHGETDKGGKKKGKFGWMAYPPAF